METTVLFAGQLAKVNCDERCEKAFGVSERPTHRLSKKEDDWEYLADHEVGEAPEDPGTSEGGHRKPINKQGIPNKWCIRECERCNMSRLGKHEEPLPIIDFTKRIHNLKPLTN
jgi:hypothetical protein